jgi:transposase
MPDSKQFTVMLGKLKERYEQLTLKNTDVTIVFDRGNNSLDNIDLLDDEDFPLFYVGGLKRNQCADLFEIPKSAFKKLMGSGLAEVTVYRTTKKVYERNMTLVVTHNQKLANGQMQSISINIEKTTKSLSDLQRKLSNRAENIVTKGKKPTKTSVEKQVLDILKTEYMKDVFDFEMTVYNGVPFFKYNFNGDRLENIKETILGKTVLFTTRHNWSNEEIVGAYRSAWHIEHSFRQLKDTEHLTVRPLFHWTDQKIKIHIFYCVLAFRLCCLLK